MRQLLKGAMRQEIRDIVFSYWSPTKEINEEINGTAYMTYYDIMDRLYGLSDPDYSLIESRLYTLVSVSINSERFKKYRCVHDLRECYHCFGSVGEIQFI